MSENGNGNGSSLLDPLNLKAVWERDVSHIEASLQLQRDALITQIVANLMGAGVLRGAEIETVKGRLCKLDKLSLIKELLASHVIWEDRI